MDDTQTLKKVAAAITEKPVSFTLDIQPVNKWQSLLQKHFPKRFPSKKTYEIKPITYGNLQRISALLLDIDVTALTNASALTAAYTLMKGHAETVAKVIAIAITNKQSEPPPALEKELLFNLTAKESLTLLSIVLEQMSIENFITTILSIRGLNVLTKVESPNEKSLSVPGNTSAT